MREGISHVSPFTSHDAILNLLYSISTLYLGFSMFLFPTLNQFPWDPSRNLHSGLIPTARGYHNGDTPSRYPRRQSVHACARMTIGPLHGSPLTCHMSHPTSPYILDTNAPHWCYPELYTHPQYPPGITCLTYTADDNDHISKPACQRVNINKSSETSYSYSAPIFTHFHVRIATQGLRF